MILSSADTNISPVSGSTTSANAICPAIRFASPNLWLNLYLPTLAKSYLLLSKNILLNNDLAASSVGSSPGLNFLYISSIASSCVFIGSLFIVVSNIGFSPNNSLIWSSVAIPMVLKRVVTGTFLVLSTRT